MSYLDVTNEFCHEDAGMIEEAVVQTLDVRVSPLTADFFQQVSPDTARTIAEFYMHHGRVVLETAVMILRAIQHFERSLGMELQRPATDDLDGLLLSLAAEVNWNEGVEDLMTSLRGFSDEGLHVQIVNMISDAVNRVRDEIAPEKVG